MGLIFNRNKKNNQSLLDTQVKLENIKLQQEVQKLTVTNRIMKTFDAQMSSHKSFPDEFYETGIKQGKYAGLYTADNALARERSRKAISISPVAESTVNTISTLTVGHGLELEAQPMWHLIPEAKGWSDQQRSDWVKDVESRFKLWSRRSSSVYDQSMNRYQQEQQEFYHGLVDGEYFHVYRYNSSAKGLNPMTVQLIRPEDVRSPSGSVVSQGNCQENGIEYNSKGQAVAYHIYNYSTMKTVRVPRVGARSGRVLVNHVKHGNKRRGVGIIANMISELVKLGDYEMLEIQAAIVNALYAVWVESPDDSDGIPVFNQGLKGGGQASATTKDYETWQNDRKEINYSQGGLQVDQLPAGHKIQSFDTKRPNVNFGVFMDQVKKNLFASKNMPISVIDKQFEDNYSASRAELILAWYEIEKYRFNQAFTDDTIYTMWLWGEVLMDKVPAPGFKNDIETREAWAYAKWIGNQRPDIDPLKSVKAHVIEQNRAYKTGKAIAQERGGGDYHNNLNRVKDELQQVAENQAPLSNNNDNGDDNLSDN